MTHSTYVDLVAFFVEHPHDAYSRSEIKDVAVANPDAYPNIANFRTTHVRSSYTDTLCRLGLIESIADGHYYRLADEDAARAILDVTNWVEERSGINRIQRRRALKDELDA